MKLIIYTQFCNPKQTINEETKFHEINSTHCNIKAIKDLRHQRIYSN